MVPDISRRNLLVAGGTAVGTLSTVSMLTENGASMEQSSKSSDWPMEQHDAAGTGYAKSASAPKDGVSVRWKRPLDTDFGFAYQSSPVVADGRVYGVGEELLCADAATGNVVFRLDRSYSVSPAVVNARAYRSPTLAFATNTAVDGLHPTGGTTIAGVHLGKIRWRMDTGTTVYGPKQPVPPVAADGTVFATLFRTLVAVDSSSGHLRWQKGMSDGRPAVHDGTVYMASYMNGTIGYDAETGEKTFGVDSDEFRPISVTAAPDCLVVGTDSGLAGVGYGESVRWQYAPEDLDRDYGAVAVAEGTAYAGFRAKDEDQLVAVETADGTERWRSDVEVASTPGFAPLSVADGIVYVPTDDRGLAAVDAGDGHVRWRFERGDTGLPWSPVALAGETLYAVGNEHLYALEEA